jgi:hypothetical protein
LTRWHAEQACHRSILKESSYSYSSQSCFEYMLD